LEIIQQAPLDVLAARQVWATSIDRHGL